MNTSEKKRGKDIVGHKDEHTAHDHGGRGCIADGLCSLAITSAMGIIPLKTADSDDDDCKYDGFQKTSLYIIKGNAGFYAGKITPFIERKKNAGGQITSEDPHYRKNRSQKWKRNERSEQAGSDKISDGVDIHDFKRVDLVGDPHDAYFCRHGGAGTGRDHHSSKYWSHFADEREGKKRAEHTLGAEHGHGIKSLQPKNQSGKKPYKQYDEHGLCAYDIDLLKDFAQKTARIQSLPESFGQEKGHLAETAQQLQK